VSPNYAPIFDESQFSDSDSCAHVHSVIDLWETGKITSWKVTITG
jgi:hypothetical protein